MYNIDILCILDTLYHAIIRHYPPLSYYGYLLSARGLIVVATVSRRGEVCIAYTSVLVNLWDPKHTLGYLYRYCSVD